MVGTHGCKQGKQGKEGKQGMQRSRPTRCGLINFFLSEQRHCQYDITPPANDSEGGRHVADIAAAFDRFCWPFQVAIRPGQQGGTPRSRDVMSSRPGVIVSAIACA